MNTLKLFKSSSIVAVMTFISRIFGFLRDMIIAHLFGATAEVDAFLVAFKIPNLMRRLFAEGAFSQAFIPVLAALRQQQSSTEVKQFIAHLTTLLISVLIVFTLIMYVLAPYLVIIFAPGFSVDPQRAALTTTLLRIMLPFVFFISLTALLSALLNSQGYFAVPAFTPVLLNLAIISAALLLHQHFSQPIMALAVGVLIGGVVQLMFQVPFLLKTNLFPAFKWNLQDSAVKRVLWLMAPAIIGVSAAQLNMIINVFFASFLPEGSVSWLYYADRLTSFPLGIFGVAIATVILPTLAQQRGENSMNDYTNTFRFGIRTVILIGFPAAIGLFMLAGPLLTTLFNYGHFTVHDVLMTRQCLQAFAWAVPAFMLIKVLATVFYSQQDIKTPVKISLFVIASNIIMNSVLTNALAHFGIALASTASAWINVILLVIFLYKRNPNLMRQNGLRFFIKLLVANGVMALLIYAMLDPLELWLHWSALSRSIHLLLIVGASVLCYGACLLGLKITLTKD